MNYPACTQKRCQEGRKACPCPDACWLPIDEPLSFWESFLWAGRWVGVVLLTLFLIFISAGYASAWWPRLVNWLSF